jgi:hypothetical protein
MANSWYDRELAEIEDAAPAVNPAWENLKNLEGEEPLSPRQRYDRELAELESEPMTKISQRVAARFIKATLTVREQGEAWKQHRKENPTEATKYYEVYGWGGPKYKDLSSWSLEDKEAQDQHFKMMKQFIEEQDAFIRGLGNNTRP